MICMLDFHKIPRKCELTEQEHREYHEATALFLSNLKRKVSDSRELNSQTPKVKRRGKIAKLIELNTTAKT